MLRELVLVTLISIVVSSPSGGYGHGHGHEHGHGHDHYAPPKYSFAYGIQDPHYGPNFGHKETRDGYITKGEYQVKLPDGRVQKVTYHVDKWGYHPVVTYSGKAHFPTHGKHHGGGGYH